MLIFLFASLAALAADPDSRVVELMKRVGELEARVDQLEGNVPSVSASGSAPVGKWIFADVTSVVVSSGSPYRVEEVSAELNAEVASPLRTCLWEHRVPYVPLQVSFEIAELGNVSRVFSASSSVLDSKMTLEIYACVVSSTMREFQLRHGSSTKTEVVFTFEIPPPK